MNKICLVCYGDGYELYQDSLGDYHIRDCEVCGLNEIKEDGEVIEVGGGQ